MMKLFMFVCVVVMVSMSGVCLGSLADDEKECADQLTSMAACIPYVSGSAKKPTQECCDDAKKLKADKPKCLCVLIKESADPSLGLPINTTLALKMPSMCDIDAKASDCPALLKMSPDSPDAKIFKDASSDTSTTTAPTTATPSSSGSSSASGSTSDSGSSSKTTTPASTSAAAAQFKLFEKVSMSGLLVSAALMLLA